MRTKNIFKTLALAMLMPTMLLTTACSSEDFASDDKTATTETVATNQGYALPVTVDVTRQADDATRATYNESTKKLAFSAGDKLFVYGSAPQGIFRFAGMLNYVPSTGKFSGTIYTENEYDDTAIRLFNSAKSTSVILLPAGYESYGYLRIDNNDDAYAYNDCFETNTNYTLATSKATAVEQFSYEHVGGMGVYNNGFALRPLNAILNFTVTGLDASTSVDVSLTGGDYNITGTVTTDASGNATFAAGVSGGTNLNEFSLTVGGNPITLVSSEKTLDAGKIYNINRAAPVVTNLSTINANYTASNGETLTGTLGANVKISIADGATVTLDGVTINGTHSTSYKWAGITCLGDATIILKDESVNSVVGFCYTYPGIYIPHGKTLTIQGETLGTGVLNATGAGYSAGIGAASESVDIYRSCGNIVIAGGVINATAGGERAAGIGCGGTTNPSTTNPSTCGTINITGGTITATGGKWAPGIGSGFYATCGDITIANTVTSVTATKGDKSTYLATTFDCIGRGREGACGTVKFGNQTMYDGSSWTTTPTSGNTYGGLSLTISQTVYEADTWTLTPVLP